MRLLKYSKYFFRFLLLQIIITVFTLWYFDNYLIGDYLEGYKIIINNLYEDRLRFYEFIPYNFIKIDAFLAMFVFIFLLVLYSTNFYSYNNDLKITTGNNLFDEFLPIYLLWTTSFLSFLQLFRFTAVSRNYLLLLTFLVPIILIIFRNTESLSRLLGRDLSEENYISFNLPESSIFREVRLLKFRNNLNNYSGILSVNEIKDYIQKENKKYSVNLIVINLQNLKITKEFEKYLLNLNKKVLIISDQNLNFNNKFLYRKEFLANSYFYYINNDIQYGSKYILKRFLDIGVTIFLSPLLIVIVFLTGFYILFRDGYPFIISQSRVGLHGKEFKMYKLRTMSRQSHDLRNKLNNENSKSGPLFKISDDPRLFKGSKWIRKYSIDEIPQFINVFKGDMSIVGPRPLFPEDNIFFDENYIRRLNVLPGITGLLQIIDRNTSDFEIWFKYDLEYIETWTLFLDIKIILKTPFSLFRSKSMGE